MRKKATLTVRMEPALYAGLKTFAHRWEVSMECVVRGLISQAINTNPAAVARMDRFRAKAQKTFAHRPGD